MQKENDLVEQSEIIALGKSLRAIESKLLKNTSKSGKNRIWFQGEEPYLDVFFELNLSDELVWFQFTLRGKSVSWDIKKPGLQTGTTNEFQVADVSFYPASKTIENDDQTDDEFIQIVKSILEVRVEETIFAKALALFS
jgi:uncharacterized protein YdaL